ncbi:hypothetical protein, partial [Dysgonomonas reticulitermitis]
MKTARSRRRPVCVLRSNNYNPVGIIIGRDNETMCKVLKQRHQMTDHKIPSKRRRLPCLETRAPFNLFTIIAVYLHSIAGRELRCTAQRLHGAGEHTIRPVATTPTDPGS